MKKSKLFAVVAAIAMTASLAVTIPARAAGIEMTYLTPAYLKGTVASTERIVADWNKANPNATVKIVYGDVNNMQDKLTTAFAGNVAPDIFQHEAASILEFSNSVDCLLVVVLLHNTNYASAAVISISDSFWPM